MAKLATVVADVISCQLLVVSGASASATLGTPSCLGLGASTRLAWLVVGVITILE
jgi:hypothetical protein